MPRDLPCAVCGSLLYRTKGSLPEGRAVCQPCRRAVGGVPHGRRDGGPATAPCAHCGITFTPRSKGKKRGWTRFCSKLCWAKEQGYTGVPTGKGHKQRALRYGARYEVIRSADVYERDGWLCQLCHEPVDKSLTWPHPKSASLDHVVPLSRGGDHLLSNVWTAHLACNCAKRDRLMSEAS